MGLATKPSTYLNWTDGDPLKVTQPPSAQQLSGWTEGEPIPFQYLNWLFYQTDQWIQWLDGYTNESQVNVENLGNARLINGGNWSWVLGTTTLAWSSAFNIAIPSVVDSDNQVAAGNATLADGQIAYVAANIPFTTTGNTQNGTNQLTNLAYVLGLVIGQTVTGAGIPGGTTITAINTGANSATMSANATATASGINLTFSGTAALTVAVATSSSFVPSVNTIVIARRVGSVVYVGVNAGQMALRDGESKALLTLGFGVVNSFTAGVSLTQNQAAYVSQGSANGDTGRTQGQAYLADPSGAISGSGRQVFAGFVQTSAAPSASVSLVTSGLMGGFTSLTQGAAYYLDPTTPGGIVATRPTTPGQFMVPVGIAVSSTQLYVVSGEEFRARLNAWMLLTAGETIAANTPVYISVGNPTDSGRVAGQCYKLDTSVTNGPVRGFFAGFTVAAVTSGNTVNVAESGVLSGFSSLTPGVLYYGDPATPGGITLTKPTVSGQTIMPVGLATSTTQIWVNAALGALAALVTTPSAYPNYFVTSSADLTTAIASATSNGGGVICLLNSFSISTAFTIPAGTKLIGRKGGAIVTVLSGGSITIATGAYIEDVWFTTALTTLTTGMLILANNYSVVRGCQFTAPSNSTTVELLVTGNSNRIYNCVFIGVVGGTTVGIKYQSGTSNIDDSSVFLP
jgi:hypothetical protein